jgi:hypothetical protein
MSAKYSATTTQSIATMDPPFEKNLIGTDASQTRLRDAPQIARKPWPPAV